MIVAMTLFTVFAPERAFELDAWICTTPNGTSPDRGEMVALLRSGVDLGVTPEARAAIAMFASC